MFKVFRTVVLYSPVTQINLILLNFLSILLADKAPGNIIAINSHSYRTTTRRVFREFADRFKNQT